MQKSPYAIFARSEPEGRATTSLRIPHIEENPQISQIWKYLLLLPQSSCDLTFKKGSISTDLNWN